MIISTYTDRSTTQLHRQGEEPTVTGAYKVRMITYTNTFNTHNTHAARNAAQMNPNQQTSKNLVWTSEQRPQEER
jgi:hypothetical protein